MLEAKQYFSLFFVHCDIFKDVLCSPRLRVLQTDETGFYLFASSNITVQGSQNFPKPLETPSWHPGEASKVMIGARVIIVNENE